MVALEPGKGFGLVWGYEEPIKALRCHIAQTGATQVKVVLLKLSYAIEPLGHLVKMQVDSTGGSWGSGPA